MSGPPSDDPLDELAEEFVRRWREGDRPSIEDYARLYPHWAEELRTVLPGVVLMEQLKPQPDNGMRSAAPTPDKILPERIGEYRILREIGRGGMGVVYEAEQETLGRRVAIKVLPRHLLVNQKLRLRFRRESRAAARLHHTNIVPVFGVGEADEDFYYVMQLIAGEGLDKFVTPGSDRELLTPARVAQVGIQVADALAYAHAQGVLHRDVKPSNLLLDSVGAIWVTDFGVAKLLEEANLTQTGEFAGTLKYMAPERFKGLSDARSDVYSLGITLYELLTRRAAFHDTTPQHLIQIIATQEALVSPRQLRPDIPIDLETIVLKAAAVEPGHRYQTPTALADDLRRFLDDRPILARRAGPAEQAWRWCRRNPLLAATTMAAFLCMLIVAVVSIVAYVNTAAANRDADQANREMEKALVAEKDQREHAEEVSTLALQALNRVYNRFTLTPLVVTPQAANAPGDAPLPQPALGPETAALMEDLLRTYEQIARSGGRFPRLQAQAAEANHQIGDICQRLARFGAAAEAYRTAIDLYTLLPPALADDSLRVKWARAYNELGRSLRALRRFDEAREMHERAIETLTEIPEQLADRPEYRYELARSYYTLGERDMSLFAHGLGLDSPDDPPPPRGGPRGSYGRGRGRRGPPSGSDTDHPVRRAALLLEPLVRKFPSVPQYRHLLACCYRDMPPNSARPGTRVGNANTDRALELLRQLAGEFPRVPDYAFDLCETLGRPVPPGPPGDGDWEDRERARLEEAITRIKELAAQYPSVPEYTAAHARYLGVLATRLLQTRETVAAETMLHQAVNLDEKLIKQHPEVVAYAYWLSLIERSLARAQSDRGELPLARARLESAIARMDALEKTEPRLDPVRTFLGLAYRDLAHVLDRSQESQLAAAALQKARQLTPDQNGRDPSGPPPPRRRGP